MNRIVLVLALAACTPPDGDDTSDATPHGAVVSTTDFAVGALAAVDLDTFAVDDALATTSSDPFVQVEDGLVYQVNGFGVDSVSVYEPGAFDAPVAQFSTGTGTSPRYVARIDDKLFVSLYETDHLAVLDPDDGTSLGEVDLSAWAGTDGIPEAATMVEANGKLYVALERLDRTDGAWSDDGGHVVEVDPATLTVARGWAVGPSPKVYPHPTDPAKLMVRTGLYAQAVGGVGELDPAAATQPARTLDAATLGFGISEWAAAPTGKAIAIAEHADYSYTVECYHPDQGVATVLGPTFDWLANPAVDDRGRAWIPLRSFDGASGLVVIDTATCAVVSTAPIGTILPPYMVAFY